MDKNPYIVNMDDRDRPSYRKHRQQRFWQIIVPIGAGILLVVAVMTLTILTATRGDPGAQISGWADTSMIWLILPILLVAVVIVLLLIAMIYLLAKTLKVLPVYTGIVQQYAALAAEKVKQISNRLTAPIINIRSSLAGINKTVGKIFGHNKG
jgi:uncharacterized BrkB/YihY/UPF0761 family membrane protein